MTLTFGCKWRLVRRSNVKSVVRRSDINSSKTALKHQAWLTIHVRNLKNLIGLIYSSERFNRLGLSISSDIMGPSGMPVGLVYPFRLTLWKKENFSLLVLDEAYLGLDRVIPNRLYVCPG